MPTRTRGFTLIEILVVIAITAIIISIAVISLGVLSDDRHLRQEGRRMIALFGVAQDEAVMQGREFGIEFTRHGYRFVEYDPFSNVWGTILGDDTLRFRELPEPAELDLIIEGQRVVLDLELAEFDDPEEERRDDAAQYAPHVLIFSSGDVTPFELHILEPARDQSVVLEASLFGDMKFADEDPDS